MYHVWNVPAFFSKSARWNLRGSEKALIWGYCINFSRSFNSYYAPERICIYSWTILCWHSSYVIWGTICKSVVIVGGLLRRTQYTYPTSFGMNPDFKATYVLGTEHIILHTHSLQHHLSLWQLLPNTQTVQATPSHGTYSTITLLQQLWQ